MNGRAIKDGVYTTPKNVIRIIEGTADVGFLQRGYEFIKRCFRGE